MNDVILNGPKLQNDLFDVLLRFRKKKIGIICDISEMYMQVGIAQDDRSMFRFLWRDLNQEATPEVSEFQRLVSGVTVAPFISQLVARENANKHKDKLPLAAQIILESTYMDDSMDSVDNMETGKLLYHELSEVWSSAGMKARKWLSNSKEVLGEVPQNHRVKEIKVSEGELPSVKT